MSKEMIVNATNLETKIALLEDDQVTEIFVERAKDKGILSNIYKGKVTKVLPGMQAAFVDIGLDRDAFLYVSDFFEDYEEYEHLFAEAEEQVEQLLKEEARKDQIQPEEPRRGRHRRDRRERGRGRPQRIAAEETPARARIEEPLKQPPAEIPKPAQEKAAVEEWHFETPAESILPESLPFEAPKPSETVQRMQDDANLPEILPDRLQTIVDVESKEDPAEELPDAEVRMRGKQDVQQFATAKMESRRKRRSSAGRGNSRILIGDLLREGQEILVQVAKEPISKKGARITSHVALAGRYLVFMPTVDHVGVSRKISTEKERLRLKDLVVKLRGDYGKGFIVRTAGENCTEDDLRQDMRYLTKLWGEIRSKAERVSAPGLVHSELSLTQRVLRDYFSEECRAIRVDDEQEYERIVEFINKIDPGLVNRVRLYNKNKPIFEEYGISQEIEKVLKQKVWLKNGGYIVINQTEALVAIDVNTGKFVGHTTSLEDTITKTNLDAVKEVVRQIRLRDLGGIIVIDFIDMDERRNQQKVMEALQMELAKDKAPSKILQFNEFGLVTITRKRSKQSLERTLSQPCTYCNGTGMTKSIRTVCYSIHQEARKMVPHLGEGGEILIRCHPDVAKTLREKEREVLQEIEEMTGKAVAIKPDPLMHIEQFDLVEL